MKFSNTLTLRQPVDKKSSTFHIVLIEPEIPQNTGNIGRTCVATNSDLHLVGKLGFEINDKNLKRAGLDYWQHLSWHHHATFEDWWKLVENPKRAFFFSAKSSNSFFDFKFQEGDWLVFGRETQGLPDHVLQEFSEQTAIIPLYGPVRGLNVATSVAVAAYEAHRQLIHQK